MLKAASCFFCVFVFHFDSERPFLLLIRRRRVQCRLGFVKASLFTRSHFTMNICIFFFSRQGLWSALFGLVPITPACLPSFIARSKLFFAENVTTAVLCCFLLLRLTALFDACYKKSLLLLSAVVAAAATAATGGGGDDMYCLVSQSCGGGYRLLSCAVECAGPARAVVAAPLAFIFTTIHTFTRFLQAVRTWYLVREFTLWFSCR